MSGACLDTFGLEALHHTLNSTRRSSPRERGRKWRPKGGGSGARARLPYREWLSLAVLGVYGAVLAGGIVLAGTEVSLVAALRTFQHTELLGLVMTVWSAGSAVGGLIYGAWHRSIPASILLTGLAALTLPVAAATSVPMIFAIVAVSGFFCAPLIAATVDELNGQVPESVRGEAMGWHGSALTAGSSLGPPVVGMILDAYGWRAGFLISGAVGLAVAAIVVLTTRRVRRRRTRCLVRHRDTGIRPARLDGHARPHQPRRPPLGAETAPTAPVHDPRHHRPHRQADGLAPIRAGTLGPHRHRRDHPTRPPHSLARLITRPTVPTRPAPPGTVEPRTP
jgi:Major Facilitator Superfamily